MIQEEWKPFREPRMLRMAKNGDNERFLCIMEINKDEILGATVTVSDRRLNDSSAWAEAMAKAWTKIHTDAEAGNYARPGTDYAGFCDFRPKED